MNKEEKHSARWYALRDGYDASWAQAMVRRYQKKFGCLEITVTGYLITEKEWEKCKEMRSCEKKRKPR